MNRAPVVLIEDGLYRGDIKPQIKKFNSDFFLIPSPIIRLYRHFCPQRNGQQAYLLDVSQQVPGDIFSRNLLLTITSRDARFCNEIFNRFQESTGLRDFVEAPENHPARRVMQAVESDCFEYLQEQKDVQAALLEMGGRRI